MSPQACGRAKGPVPGQVRRKVRHHRASNPAQGGGDDRIRATFRTERYRPTCTVCQTPIDYRIRPSNAQFPRAGGRRAARVHAAAAARAARETRRRRKSASPRSQKKKEDARKLAIAQGRLAPAGSPANILAKTNALAMFSSSIAPTFDETLDSMNATLNTDTEKSGRGVFSSRASSRNGRQEDRPGSAGTDDSDDAAAYVRR